jgi:hypothetical protein
MKHRLSTENGDASIIEVMPTTGRKHLKGLSKLFSFKRLDKLAIKTANVIGRNDQ